MNTARRKMYDFTWWRGKSLLDFWYTDDTNREANWKKAHALYVTGRDLPEDSPYGFTLQEVMDAQAVCWHNDAVGMEDIKWANAEQHALKWSVPGDSEWMWFKLSMDEADDRIGSVSFVVWYGIYDEQYAAIHEHTRSSIAIASFSRNKWYETHLDRLTRSKSKRKIALVSTNVATNAQIEEDCDRILAIPGCDVGVWSGPEPTAIERERLQECAEIVERKMGYMQGGHAVESEEAD